MTYAIEELYFFEIWVGYYDDASDAVYVIERNK